MANLNRRDFVRTSAGLLAVPAAMGAAGMGMGENGRLTGAKPAPARSFNRAEKVGIGFIGCGKRAIELIGPFLDRGDARVLAVCDVDTNRRESMKKRVDGKYGAADCRSINDYHELLATLGIDAVVITTPDHWHANQIIDSAKAKKDIYCEKPLTLTLAEGKACIDAVRKHERVFQTGSQQRTEYDGKFRTACEYVRSGRIGRIVSVNVGVQDPPKACDLTEETSEPGLDWDRWLGPAPMRGYNSILSPRGVHNHYPMWRLYWEYAGGLLADMGAHHFDIAQWGLDMDTSGPVQVHPPGDGAAVIGARLVYANGVEMHHGGPSGTTFVGSGGIIAVDRDRLNCVPEGILKKGLEEKDVHLPKPADHISDWMDCIRSRARCICDVEVGARSAAVCQLVNTAYRYRQSLTWDPAKWEFTGNEKANAWRDYERRRGFELPRA